MTKIIKNGTIVTATDTYEADLLIKDGKIAMIGQHLEEKGAEVIDAKGCYVFPGGIDPHTHLDMPFGGTVTKDDFESGTIAAAFGGTTTIIDFCLTNKGEPLKKRLKLGTTKRREKRLLIMASI